MEPDDFDAFCDVLRPVAAGLNEPFTIDRIKYYFAALIAYDLEVLRVALLATANQAGRAFFPKPGEIIATIEGEPQTRATIAWQRFLHAVEHLGPDSPVTFEDPTLHAVVMQLGDWPAVCLWDRLAVDELGYRGVEFRKLYQHFLAHPDPATPTILNAQALALTTNPVRAIDRRGLPALLPAQALRAAEDVPKFDPNGAAQALQRLAIEVNTGMTRLAPDSARTAARAIELPGLPLSVEPTAEERASHDRRRQAALNQVRAAMQPAAGLGR